MELNNHTKLLLKEKIEIKRKIKETKQREQIENTKVHIREIKGEYLIASARVGNKVHSSYLGKKDKWKDWQKNKELKKQATNKMKLKLKKVAVKNS